MSTVERDEASIDDVVQPIRDGGDGTLRRRSRTHLPLVTDREAWPRGWYDVCFADDLKRGAVRGVRMFGADWAVFRTRSGKVGVVDAVCRHLGADLAAAGRVKGEHLQCGFHGWEFGCDGVCEAAPGVDRPPRAARQLPLHAMEHLGTVWVWYGDGDPSRSPRWGKPTIRPPT